MDGYRLLKRADDARWTNAARRDVLKSEADAGLRWADARAEHLRQAELTNAGRLTEAKRAAAEAASRLAAAGGGDEAGGPRQSAALERSMRRGLSATRRLLAECRDRVAGKMARLDALQARASSAAAAASSTVTASGLGPGTAPDLAALDKTSEALRLGNRRAARARDLIAENLALRSALNAHLEADVRRMAAAVVELLVRGSCARRDEAEFNERYARAEAEHEREADRAARNARRLGANIADLDYHRRKMIFDKEQIEQDEGSEMIFSSNTDLDENLSTTSTPPMSSASDDRQDMMLLMDWINTGPMERQMYGESDDHTNDPDEMTNRRSDGSHFEDFTYPRKKVNRFKYAGDATDPARRAAEAVDYVRDTLGFADPAQALRFVDALEGVEARLIRMTDARCRGLDALESTRRTTAEAELERVYCTPEATTRLEEDLERVRRAADEQRERLRQARATVGRYGTLFDQLRFQLDALAEKLGRCHVPAVRRYRLHAQKRAGDTEATQDARRMLQGLCLTFGDDEAAARALPVPSPDPAAGPEADVSSDRRVCPGPAADASGGPKGPAADPSGLPCRAVAICRDLTATLRAKIGSCMVRIGGDFDAADDKQLAARAYYVFDEQSRVQRALLRQADRGPPARPKIALEDTDDGTAAAGVMTREQTKRQADDIVRWFRMPKDSDQAVNSRKPISFRKSRIVLRS